MAQRPAGHKAALLTALERHLKAGLSYTQAAQTLGIAVSTAKTWARENGFTKAEIDAARQELGGEDANTILEAEIEDLKRRALTAHRANKQALAESLIREAERQSRYLTRIDKIESEHARPDYAAFERCRNQLICEIVGVEATEERLTNGVGPRAWDVWHIVPNYYDALKEAGAVMLDYGWVAWPNDVAPPRDTLPPTPHWMPADPWDQTYPMERWIEEFGGPFTMLSGPVDRRPEQVDELRDNLGWDE